MTTVQPAAPAGRLAPLRHRDFRLLVGGTATSSLGNAITLVALAFAVLDLGGSPTDLGIVVGAFALAEVVTALLGGVLGDRVSRKIMMEGSAAACTMTQGLLAVLLLGGWANIPSLAVIGAVNGCLGALSQPSSAAMTRLTVPAGLLGSAVALRAIRNETVTLARRWSASAWAVSWSPPSGLAGLLPSTRRRSQSRLRASQGSRYRTAGRARHGPLCSWI